MRGLELATSLDDRMDDGRAPVVFLAYPGDLRDTFHPLRPLGPNAIGERLWPIAAEYDADADQTRVGLSYITPPAIADLVGGAR